MHPCTREWRHQSCNYSTQGTFSLRWSCSMSEEGVCGLKPLGEQGCLSLHVAASCSAWFPHDHSRVLQQGPSGPQMGTQHTSKHSRLSSDTVSEL